jgi:hypothetical protein
MRMEMAVTADEEMRKQRKRGRANEEELGEEEEMEETTDA